MTTFAIIIGLLLVAGIFTAGMRVGLEIDIEAERKDEAQRKARAV